MAQEAIFLTKGTPSPYDGFLFDVEGARKIKNRLIEADYWENLSKSLEIQINLYEDIDKRNQNRYNLMLEQNDKLALALKNQQNFNNLERFVWFFGGVLAAILATYGIKQVTK